jgi:hypothetical protein
MLPKPAYGMKAAVEGVFGEEDVQVMLRQFNSASIAQGLAPGLTGGRYRIDEYKKDKDHRSALLFATDWDSEDSATAFFNAYQAVLEKKWKHLDKDKGDQDAGHYSGKSEDGYYRVERKGRTVLSREGFAGKI